MSVKLFARGCLVASFALALGACGGGSSSDEDGSLGGPQPGGGGGSGGGSTPGETQEVSLALGTGEGSSFVQGQIATDIEGELASRGQTVLKVSVVDALAGNELIMGQPIEVHFT